MKYKLIKKHKNDHFDKPVSLLETKYYENQKNDKFIVINLINNYDDILNHISIDIEELNLEGNLIRTSSFEFDNLNVEKGKMFIPFGKIGIAKQTDVINLVLNKATYLDNTYTLDGWEIELEVEEVLDTSNNFTEEEIVRTNIKTINAKRKIYPFLIPVLIVAVFVLLIATNTVKAYNENLENNGLFEYTLRSNDTVAITKYNGSDRHVSIPGYINQYRVAEIGSHAFSYSNIKSVYINADSIEIGIKAFYSAYSLREVIGLNVTVINSHAFGDSPKLRRLSFNRVDLVKTEAFLNTKQLRSFDINTQYNTTYEKDAFKNSGLRDPNSNTPYFKKESILEYI